MRTLLNLLCICLLAIFANAALAQGTPDGETPAQETVCNDNNFIGAAWGLCNAYCEAMDCDCGTPSSPNCVANASQKACDRVLANFYKHVGPGVVLSCEEVLPPEFFDLEVEVIGGGTSGTEGGDVTSDVAGEGMDTINCPDTVCNETFADGTVVTLTATADMGWSFVGWSGADCSGTSSTAVVTMDQNRSCTATFQEDTTATCPCFDSTAWSVEEAGLIWEDFDGGLSIPTSCTDDPPLTEILQDLGEGDFVKIAVDDPAGTGDWQCLASDSFGTSGSLDISAAEAVACAADLLDLAAGLVCGP